MHFTVWLSHFFWFSHCALQSALFVELVRRRFYLKFPYFVSYTLAASLKSSLLIAMNYSPAVTGDTYTYAFFAGDAVVTALTFGVLYEIFQHVFRDYPVLRNIAARIFRWVTITLLFVAIGFAWVVPGAGTDHLMSMYFALQRSLNIVECGLVIFLILSSRYFHLAFRSYTFGIALGLGLLAACNLAIAAVRSQIEPGGQGLSYRVMNAVSEATYFGCVLVWFIYLLKQKRDRDNNIRIFPAKQLETWSQELQRLIHQ